AGWATTCSKTHLAGCPEMRFLSIKGSLAYPERDEEDEKLHEVSWKDFTYMDADVWDNFQQGTGITRSTNNRRKGQYRGTISHLRHCRKDVVAPPPVGSAHLANWRPINSY
ncbi:uncharacterized protein BKA55DRAFT_531094, partial [Fusarium redolens]